MNTVIDVHRKYINVYDYLLCIICSDSTHGTWMNPLLSIIILSEANITGKLVSMLADFTTGNSMWLLKLTLADTKPLREYKEILVPLHTKNCLLWCLTTVISSKWSEQSNNWAARTGDEYFFTAGVNERMIGGGRGSYLSKRLEQSIVLHFQIHSPWEKPMLEYIMHQKILLREVVITVDHHFCTGCINRTRSCTIGGKKM